MNIYIVSHSLPSIDHPELSSCSNVSSFIGIYIYIYRVVYYGFESLKVRLYKYITDNFHDCGRYHVTSLPKLFAGKIVSKV